MGSNSRRKPARKPRRGNLAAAAAARLRTAIVRGEYAAQEPLREIELSRRLGISRIPLREALHRLVGEGLVELRPNRSAVVASMTEAEIGQIAEVCRLIETHLIRTAMPDLDASLLAKAAALVERMDETDDVVDWFHLNWAFHSTLYVPAERPLLVELVASLRARADRYIYILAKDRKRRDLLNQEHRRILAACKKRQAERAARLLDDHLEGGKVVVARLLPH